MTWSSLYINFSNDYYPSRDRYDPVRWEEDRCFIMKTLPDSLTDCHSIIRQDYRASLDIGIDDCYARMKELRMLFPEYEVDSISLFGESILPVKKDGKIVLLNTKTRTLAFNDVPMTIRCLITNCILHHGTG